MTLLPLDEYPRLGFINQTVILIFNLKIILFPIIAIEVYIYTMAHKGSLKAVTNIIVYFDRI